VVIRFTTPEAAPSALRTGEGDMANGQDALPDETAQLNSIPGITTTIFPSLSQETLYFSQRNEQLAIPEVRKAVAMALDRRTIYERVFSKGSTVGVVNSLLWANSQPAYHDTSGGLYDRQDIAAAKRLLEAAGYSLGGDGVYGKEGKRLSFRLLTISAPPRDQEAELVQSQLKSAGVELSIDAVPLAAFQQTVVKGAFEMAIASFGESTFGTVNLAPGSSLATTLGYSNTTLDVLMQQAHGELDEMKRLALIDQGDHILWHDLPMVPLFQRPLLFAVRSTYVNIGPNVVAGAFWNVEQWARRAPP
jgi:peptide/nickel transport system substrate-binding protein